MGAGQPRRDARDFRVADRPEQQHDELLQLRVRCFQLVGVHREDGERPLHLRHGRRDGYGWRRRIDVVRSRHERWSLVFTLDRVKKELPCGGSFFAMGDI